MSSPVAGPLRAGRAVLSATLVLALTAVAHRMGGGTLPDPLLLAALAAFTLAGTTAAARFRFTAPRLVVVLGGAQLALHGALTWLGGCAPSGTGSLGATGPHAGHLDPALAAGIASSLPDAAASADPTAHLATAAAGWGMLAAHAAATVVLALVLARGERALERLVAWLTSRLARVPRAVTLPTGRRAVVGQGGVRPVANRHVTAAPTRGPPVAGRHVGNIA